MGDRKASPKRSRTPKSPQPPKPPQGKLPQATLHGVPFSKNGPLLNVPDDGHMFEIGDVVVYFSEYGATELIGTVPDGTDIDALYDVVDGIALHRYNVTTRIMGGVRKTKEHGYIDADASGLKLSDLAHREIKQKTDDAVAAFIHGIPERVENILGAAVHSAIGVKKGTWNDYEIARDSVLMKVINCKATARAEVIAEALVADSLGKLDLNQPLKSAAMKVAHQTYREVLTKRISEGAIKRAEADAEACMETLSGTGLGFNYQRARDLANPGDFEGQIGDILLEYHAGEIDDE